MPAIRYITRFNPTVNGPLHVGHIYTCLVNEYEAHASGGKFIVRFEDNQTMWVFRREGRMSEIMDGMKEDLEWMGVGVDEYQRQSELDFHCKDLLQYLLKCELPVAHRYEYDPQPEVIYANDVPYPYAAHLTAERVVMDFMTGVNLLIRGQDLVTEYSLYAYFCEIMGLPRPRMVYLPRLHAGGNDLLSPALDKTTGNYKVSDYRKQGISYTRLLEMLRQACLIDPAGEWSIRNIKMEPAWQPG